MSLWEENQKLWVAKNELEIKVNELTKKNKVLKQVIKDLQCLHNVNK
jgi:hypothetical protein